MWFRNKSETGFSTAQTPVLIMGISAMAAISFPLIVSSDNQGAESLPTETAESTVIVPEGVPQLGAAPSYDSMTASYAGKVAEAVEAYALKNPDAGSISMLEIREYLAPHRVGWADGSRINVMGVPNDFCVVASHSEGQQYKTGNNWDNGRPYYLYSSEMGGEVTMEEYSGGVTGLSCGSSSQLL